MDQTGCEIGAAAHSPQPWMRSWLMSAFADLDLLRTIRARLDPVLLYRARSTKYGVQMHVNRFRFGPQLSYGWLAEEAFVIG
jgi:hypothetical protein